VPGTTSSFRLEVCDPAFPPITDTTTGLQICDPEGLKGEATVSGVGVE
jgi:hypothetical protein